MRFRPMDDKLITNDLLAGLSIPMQQFINIFLAANFDNSFLYNVPLWFLPCLFVAHVIYHWLNKLNLYYKIGGGILGLLIFYVLDLSKTPLPWFIGIALVAVPFLIIGKYSYLLIQKHNTKPKQKAILFFVFTILFVLSGVFSDTTLNMKTGAIPAPWFLYTIPVFGTACMYYLSALLDRLTKVNRLLIWLGQNSLLIMCLHEPIKRIVIKICSVAMHCETNALRESDLASFLMAIITVAICIPFVLFISKKLPWIIGKAAKR